MRRIGPLFAENDRESTPTLALESWDDREQGDFFRERDPSYLLEQTLITELANITEQERMTMGHSLPTMLLDCKWKGYPCSPLSNTETSFPSSWGAPPIPKKRRSPSPGLQEAPPKPAKPPRLNLGDILKAFGENTTAHGVPAITRSKRVVAKLFWLAVFLIMLGLFCFQATLVLVEYYGYPSTTKVKLETAPYLNFPSVTICNMNRFRRSKLVGTRFEGLIHLDGGMTGDDGTLDYGWFFDWDTAWLDEYMEEYGSGNQAGDNSAPSPLVNTDWYPPTADGLVDTNDGTSIANSEAEMTGSVTTGSDLPSFFDPDAMIVSASDVNSGDVTTKEVTSEALIDATADDTYSSDNQPTASITSIVVYESTNESVTNQQTTLELTSSVAQSTSSPTAASEGSTTQVSSGTTHLPGSTAQIQSTSDGGGGTGTSSRKKRSIRNIRGTSGSGFGGGTNGSTSGSGGGTGTSGGGSDLTDTAFEFGSWVQNEWNEGYDDDQFEFHYEQFYDWGDMTDPNDWQGFYDRSQSADYSDFLEMVNPSRAELRDLGHEAEDLIVQCTYDKRKCSYENFHQFQNKEYGNCFTFNYGSKLLENMTTHSGAQYGLHLTLFIEMPEYVGILSPEAGARVSIHPHNVPPFPEDDGITVAPGMSTNIGLRQVYIERKGEPYNPKCHVFTTGLYSRKSCLKTCEQSEMFNRCQCVTDVLLENKTKCSFLNQTQQTCKQLIEYLGEEDKLDCSCPISCNETSYTKSVSASSWPSERYEEHLQRRLRESSSDAAMMSANDESTGKNLLRVRVYFEELNYQSIRESALYTFPTLLGSLGGLLGLYIGISFLTLCEVFILIFDVCRYLIKKAFCKNDISPSSFILVEEVRSPEYSE
ncbi:uncharacterized protein [Asterias amurensis]|uniref:uncharacterized protein n=1 Tax=Asterias amurensis TaxID=7602 RepID=UPI003AB73E54